MVSFFKLLGIGYVLAILLLIWELVDITLHSAAAPYTGLFTAMALIGFLAFYLFVRFAPESEK
jgi:terminal oxidase small hydrophobic subunit